MKKAGNLFLAIAAALILALGGSGCTDDSDAAPPAEDAPKYVILMVPDGMGLSNVTAARIFKNGPNGDPLDFEELPYIGYQRTHSRNSTVTDSAAAASAWASGEKFNNGEISCLDDNGDGVCDETRINTMTVLEIAEQKGLSTGLVATSDITHATPAVFGAHVHNRKCESEVFEQFLANNIEVLLGGGIATNRSSCLLTATDAAYNANLITDAQNNHGYTYVTTETELAAVPANTGKLLGLFKDGGLTPIYQRGAANDEPTLAEMTEAALKVLGQNEDGFFLMVEGSQIDWANHARDLKYQIGETLDFNDAFKVVKNWAAQDKDRYNNTLVVVVADHETGGFIIEGPYGTLSNAGDTATQATDMAGNLLTDDDANPIYEADLEGFFGSNAANYTTQSANHTAVDTIIWSNNWVCGQAMDNTDLYNIMVNWMN